MNKRKKYFRKHYFTFFYIVLISMFFIYCSSSTKGKNIKNAPTLTGDYLGQIPPGFSSELFAPGIIATEMADRDITISPDLSEIYYGILESPYPAIAFMKKVNNQWTTQKLAPFSGEYHDVEAQFSPDGQKLFFCSNRPLKKGDKIKDWDIWYLKKTLNGWSKPINPGSPLNSAKNEFYPSITNQGSVYFTSFNMDIYKSELVNGKFSTPEKLPDTINTNRGEYNAYVSPNEKYLIFTSHGWDRGVGRGDLFISFKKPDGSWTKAANLGPEVNSPDIEMCPSVSPDGKYLFFSSNKKLKPADNRPRITLDQIKKNAHSPQNGKMDIYWIDARIIEKLKPSDLK